MRSCYNYLTQENLDLLKKIQEIGGVPAYSTTYSPPLEFANAIKNVPGSSVAERCVLTGPDGFSVTACRAGPLLFPCYYFLEVIENGYKAIHSGPFAQLVWKNLGQKYKAHKALEIPNQAAKILKPFKDSPIVPGFNTLQSVNHVNPLEIYTLGNIVAARNEGLFFSTYGIQYTDSQNEVIGRAAKIVWKQLKKWHDLDISPANENLLNEIISLNLKPEYSISAKKNGAVQIYTFTYHPALINRSEKEFRAHNAQHAPQLAFRAVLSVNEKTSEHKLEITNNDNVLKSCDVGDIFTGPWLKQLRRYISKTYGL